MVTFELLDGIAWVVWKRYDQLRSEVGRLAREEKPVSDFRVPPDPGLPPGFPRGLPAIIREDYFDLRDHRKACPFGGDRKHPWTFRNQPLALWYVVSAEVKDVMFVFTTVSASEIWPPEAPLEVRQRQRRKLRELEPVIRAGHRATKSGTPLKGQKAEEWKRAKDQYRRLAGRDWHYNALRNSHRAKQERWAWAWQAEERDALVTQLGPIVLSSRTSGEEISLKMALLSARQGILGPGAERAVSRLQTYLQIRAKNPHAKDPAEVFSLAAMGYAGDFSPVSFRAYLRKLARQPRPPKEEIGLERKTIEALADGDETGDEMRRVSRERPGRPWLEPEDTTHSWDRGEPVLLRRLASEDDVPYPVAYSWCRAAKLGARDCPERVELTAQGEPIKGRIEVLASERERWQELRSRYLDMRHRKKSAGTSAAEKKRGYRESRKPGGSLEKIREYISGKGRKELTPGGRRSGTKRQRPPARGRGGEPSEGSESRRGSM